MKKGRISDILIGVVLTYLFLGISIVSVQALSGASCGPIKLGGDYVYTVNAEAPRFWGLRILKWLPVAWDNLAEDKVPVLDFLSPKECIWVPAGKSPTEAMEDAENPLGGTR